MKSLLIYPGLLEGFDSFRKGNDWFNHGIGILSSLLKEKGHHVGYIDCRKLKGWTSFRKMVSSTDFEIAMISVATVDFDISRKISRLIREARPSAKIMVGGPHPTLMTEQTDAVPEFDYVFTHEAEITLPGLLEKIPDIPRISRGAMPPDLDALPMVDRSLAPDGETPLFEGLDRPYFSITASRGCLYKCTFCQPAERYVFGDNVRKRSVDNIIAELRYLSKNFGMRSFMIHDDCFTQFYRWVEEFCDKKMRHGLYQPFACQTRSDIVCKRPDLMKRLVDAGLRWVLIGFESGSDRILQFIRKGTTVEENIEAARICRELGIKIFANYMFGLPTETPEEMRQTARMIRDIRPDACSPAIFTPAPGSELYDYCLSNDLSLIDNSADYSRSVNSGAKIRGVDYRLIRRMVKESIHGHQQSLISRLPGVLAARMKRLVESIR